MGVFFVKILESGEGNRALQVGKCLCSISGKCCHGETSSFRFPTVSEGKSLQLFGNVLNQCTSVRAEIGVVAIGCLIMQGAQEFLISVYIRRYITVISLQSSRLLWKFGGSSKISGSLPKSRLGFFVFRQSDNEVFEAGSKPNLGSSLVRSFLIDGVRHDVGLSYLSSTLPCIFSVAPVSWRVVFFRLCGVARVS